MSELPLYELVIKEDELDATGVDFIALVGQPAIKRNWSAFSDEVLKTFVFKSDKEKRIISGPAMIPDMPIYRRNDKGDEWEVVFRKPTIQRIIEKFFKQQNTANFNLEHKKNLLADGVYLIESFMIDEERGIKAPQGFEDLPDGTWFISCKVDNDSIWNDFVKTGKFNGFSVEGFFMEKPVDEFQEVTDLLSKLQPKLNKIFTDNMSTAKDLLAKLKLVFEEMPETKVEEKMNEAKLADGVTIVRWDGEELAEGTALNVVTEEGIIPAPDGTHELQDGRKIETKDGKVIMIESAKEQEQEKEVEIELSEMFKSFKETFATGTPEERIAKLEAMVKALFKDRFDWQIREEERQKDMESALAVYKSGFEDASNKLKEQTATIEKQSKIIAGLFEVVEKIADEPSAEAFKTEIFNTNFSEKRQNVHNRVEEIATYLKQLNTK